MRGWDTDDILEFHPHPHYTGDDKNLPFDIAMIILDSPIDWKTHGIKNGSENLFIYTICLPKEEHFIQGDLVVGFYANNPYTNATLFGFDLATVLQRGDVLVKYDDILKREFLELKAESREARACKVSLVSLLNDSIL